MVEFTEGSRMKTNLDKSDCKTEKPKIIPKGQMAEPKITLTSHPTFYGQGNVTFAFQNKELGFELSIRTANYKNSYILTKEQVLLLKDQINRSFDAHSKFMNT